MIVSSCDYQNITCQCWLGRWWLWRGDWDTTSGHPRQLGQQPAVAVEGDKVSAGWAVQCTSASSRQGGTEALRPTYSQCHGHSACYYREQVQFCDEDDRQLWASPIWTETGSRWPGAVLSLTHSRNSIATLHCKCKHVLLQLLEKGLSTITWHNKDLTDFIEAASQLVCTDMYVNLDIVQSNFKQIAATAQSWSKGKSNAVPPDSLWDIFAVTSWEGRSARWPQVHWMCSHAATSRQAMTLQT